MRRHIKVAFKAIDEKWSVMKILEQTHLGLSFNNKSEKFIYENTEIFSANYPSMPTEDLKGKLYVSVRGIVSEHNNTPVVVRTKYVSQIKEAITAYNERFSGHIETEKTIGENWEIVE